ncbi:MAG: DUF2332 domain-containing protein [Gammaproteobacteria bacterium]
MVRLHESDLAAARTLMGHWAYTLACHDSFLEAALCEHLAADDELLGIAMGVRPGQHMGYMLFNSVQYLLGLHPDEPLAAWYPSYAAHPKPREDAWPVFREFCLRRRAELAHLLATRTVQTTAADRANFVMLGLAWIARRVGEPLSVIEIGSSAGLCLQFDRYRYRTPDGRVIGPADSPVTLELRLRNGFMPAPAAVPRVAWRAGVDLAPVDARDADARRWIEASIFPEWIEERARLRAALELAAARPLRIERGDALEALPSLMAETSGPLVLFHSCCVIYWPREAVQRLHAMLREASRARPIHVLGIELDTTTSIEEISARFKRGLAPPVRIEHWQFERGDEPAHSVLADCDGYGRWIEWREEHGAG